MAEVAAKLKAQKAAHGLGDDPFLVGGNHADGNPAGTGGNDGSVGGVFSLVELDSEEREIVTNAGADDGCAFADAASEDEGVESAKSGGVGAEEFFCLIAEDGDGGGGAGIAGRAAEQVAHVGAGAGQAEETGLEIDELVELARGHFFGAGEETGEAGIKVARAGAHDEAGGRCEGHAGVDGPTVFDGGHARAVAQVGEDEAAAGGARTGEAAKFPEEKFVGQAVKTVAADAFGVVAKRNRQQLRDARHGAMERGVEAGDLREFGKAAEKGGGQDDFFGQMLGVKRDEAAQRAEEIRGDAAGRAELRAAVDDAVADGGKLAGVEVFLQPGGQGADGGEMGGGGRFVREGFAGGEIFDGEGSAGQADAFDGTGPDAAKGGGGLEEGELDARRASVDGEDLFGRGGRGLHGSGEAYHEWGGFAKNKSAGDSAHGLELVE